MMFISETVPLKPLILPVKAKLVYETNNGDAFDKKEDALIAHYDEEMKKLTLINRQFSIMHTLHNRDAIMKLLSETKQFLPEVQ